MSNGTSVGRLEWIGIRPARRAPVLAVARAELQSGRGIVGDHYRPKRGGRREITLIQHEHLLQIAEGLKSDAVAPEVFRRNLVVSGLEIAALQGRRFRIGAVVLEGTGPCSPCARMDEALGPGGRQAMSRRGGITAIVLQGGEIGVGDTVELSPDGGETTLSSHSQG